MITFRSTKNIFPALTAVYLTASCTNPLAKAQFSSPENHGPSTPLVSRPTDTERHQWGVNLPRLNIDDKQQYEKLYSGKINAGNSPRNLPSWLYNVVRLELWYAKPDDPTLDISIFSEPIDRRLLNSNTPEGLALREKVEQQAVNFEKHILLYHESTHKGDYSYEKHKKEHHPYSYQIIGRAVRLSNVSVTDVLESKSAWSFGWPNFLLSRARAATQGHFDERKCKLKIINSDPTQSILCSLRWAVMWEKWELETIKERDKINGPKNDNSFAGIALISTFLFFGYLADRKERQKEKAHREAVNRPAAREDLDEVIRERYRNIPGDQR